MKPKILVLLIIGLLSVSAAFAYTPSSSLEIKLNSVVERFESIIDTKWESYRSKIIDTLETYQAQVSNNEKGSYIIHYLITELSSDNTSQAEGSIGIDSDYSGAYTINDVTYGSEVEVTIVGDTRTMTSNAIANHAVGTFPNEGNPNTISAQEKTFTFDLTPTYTGDASWTRETGAAYNGVKFEFETNERIECSSGETYRLEAIQDFASVGLDDFAHVQPTGEYHYHGVSAELIATLEWDDVVHVGYANDGFPIYYSKNGSYDTSFSIVDDNRVGTSCTYRGNDVAIEGTSPDGTYVSDWEYDASGDLDSCNGTFIDGEYSYFITDDYPYGPRCLNGTVTTSAAWWNWGPWGEQTWWETDKMGPPPGWSSDDTERRGPPPQK